jgi:fumarate reductase subunit C
MIDTILFILTVAGIIFAVVFFIVLVVGYHIIKHGDPNSEEYIDTYKKSDTD